MKISLKQLGFIFYAELLISIVLIVIYCMLNSDNIVNSDTLVVVSFALIGIVSIYNLMRTHNKAYSLNLVHWLFIFIFLFIAPLLQYFAGNLPWNTIATDYDYFYANILILIWCFLYSISYRHLVNNKRNKILSNKHVFQLTKPSIYFNFILSLVVFVYFLYLIGPANFLSRYAFAKTVFSLPYDTSVIQIVTITLRAVPLLSLASVIISKNLLKYSYRYIMLTILLVINLIVNNPFGAARFWSGSIVIGFFIILLGKKVKNANIISLIFILGLLFVFPAINVFRYIDITDFSLNYLKNINPLDVLLSGDFDAYSMFIRTIQYVRENSITFGKQLIGVLLFFVPRNLWSTKPIGSGALVAINQGLSYTNLSSPIQAEAYINFGIVGIGLFAIAIGILNKKIDEIYWTLVSNQNDTKSLLELIYPFLIGLVFFNMRGSLLSTYASLVGFIIPIIGYMFINAIFTSIKRGKNK